MPDTQNYSVTSHRRRYLRQRGGYSTAFPSIWDRYAMAMQLCHYSRSLRDSHQGTFLAGGARGGQRLRYIRGVQGVRGVRGVWGLVGRMRRLGRINAEQVPRRPMSTCTFFGYKRATSRAASGFLSLLSILLTQTHVFPSPKAPTQARASGLMADIPKEKDILISLDDFIGTTIPAFTYSANNVDKRAGDFSQAQLVNNVYFEFSGGDKGDPISSSLTTWQDGIPQATAELLRRLPIVIMYKEVFPVLGRESDVE